MTHHSIVTRIPDGGPECRGPRAIDLDERVDAPYAPSGEDLLHASHEFPTDAVTAVIGMDHQSIHVAPPAVEGPEQCPDDFVSVNGQHEDCRRVLNHAAYLLDVIGRAHARAGGLP
jgi:hypothetical protein